MRNEEMDELQERRIAKALLEYKAANRLQLAFIASASSAGATTGNGAEQLALHGRLMVGHV